MKIAIDLEAIYEVQTKIEDERLKIHILGGREALEWSFELRTFLPSKEMTWLDPKVPQKWKARVAEKLEKLRSAIDDAIQRATEIAEEWERRYGAGSPFKESERRQDGSCD